jgi:DNA-binding MarR family transcriptional regulator
MMAVYRLEDQVGYLLRRAQQRHTAIFARHMAGDLTPTQFAALVKVCEAGEISQNELGRQTAMDAATIKGVIDRLAERGLVAVAPDSGDRRRLVLRPTESGLAQARRAIELALDITRETLAPLTPDEQAQLLPLLMRLGET